MTGIELSGRALPSTQESLGSNPNISEKGVCEVWPVYMCGVCMYASVVRNQREDEKRI